MSRKHFEAVANEIKSTLALCQTDDQRKGVEITTIGLCNVFGDETLGSTAFDS